VKSRTKADSECVCILISVNSQEIYLETEAVSKAAGSKQRQHKDKAKISEQRQRKAYNKVTAIHQSEQTNH